MAIESHLLTVRDVVVETADARSIVFEVPEELSETFAYVPGQFLTLAIPSEQTGLVARSYSLSSAPHENRHQVTVKRTAEGYASNWICDHLRPGDTVRVLPPSGIFTPRDWNSDVLLFAGGSGITPILSIARTALERHDGAVTLFYANRDEASVIFAATLRQLQDEHPDRFEIVHWLESLQGIPSAEALRRFAQRHSDATAMVCGPGPFMSAVTGVLKDLEFPRERRQQEKFVSLGGNPFGDVPEMVGVATKTDDSGGASSATGGLVAGPVRVEVHLDDQDYAFDDWNGREPLLVFLESKGVDAPYSCREGQCSACACMVLEGDLALLHNEVLEADDLADGIRLACQAVALSNEVRVTYNG